MRWVRGRAAAFLVATTVIVGVAPSPASAATLTASNSVVFTHDRWHPERTVVGSSTRPTRQTAGLTLTISVVPSGKTARVTAVLTNTGTTTARFSRRGARVDAAVVRNGRSQGTWILWASRLRTLTPGTSRVLSGAFALPKPGTYVVTASARF